MALLLVLERLNPAERAAFVLHDVFGFSFDDVAKVVGRSSQASRQLASRARRRIQAETEPARFEVDPVQLSHVAKRFIEAATTGSAQALMDVLDPDVVGWTDGGGFVPAPQQAVAGREHVAETFLRFMRTFEVRMRPMTVNAEPGLLLFQGERLIGVAVLESRDGLITRIHGIANPQKIAYVASLIGALAGLP
jgi:RNA polymerase sigma-70 factor (ECF subfamily)